MLSACSGDSEPDVSVPDAEPTQSLPQAEAVLPPPAVNITKDTGDDGGEGEEIPPEVLPEGVVEEENPDGGDAGINPAVLHPWPAERFGYGVQSHAIVGDPKYTMDVVANQLHMDWIKVQFEWALVQPSPDVEDWFHYDGVVNDAHEQGLNLMFSVVGAPTWTRASGDHNGPPDDFNLYAEFVQKIVTRYQGRVHAIEVWNEQNLDRE